MKALSVKAQASPLTLDSSGMTLVELIIAVGISFVVVLGSLQWVVETMRNLQLYRSQSALAEGALLVSDTIATEIQGSGGGSSHGWTSIGVENNCAASGPFPDCNGSDRLTISQLETGYNQRQVVSNMGNQLHIESTGGCELTEQMENQFFKLVNGDNFANLYAEDIDTTSCRIRFRRGQGRVHDVIPASSDWSGASATFMAVKTFFLNPTTHELYQFTDLNSNDAIDPGEALMLADNVYDFQVTLGYDFSPADRIVTDLGSNLDEWLYNSTGENFGQGFFISALRNQLRLVRIAVVLGSPGPSGAKEEKINAGVFDGPARSFPGLSLQLQTSQVLLRNMPKF